MSSGIPHTLDECFIALKGIVPEKQLELFRRSTETHFVTWTHNTLGRRIRNAWGLWAGSELKTHLEGLGLTHPDDMSGVILTSFWRHLNGIPLDVEGQVEHYKEYWRKIRGNP